MPDLRAEIIEQGQGGYKSGRELCETRSRGYLRRCADERGGFGQSDYRRRIPVRHQRAIGAHHVRHAGIYQGSRGGRNGAFAEAAREARTLTRGADDARHDGRNDGWREPNASCTVEVRLESRLYAYILPAPPYLDCPLRAGNNAIRPVCPCRRSVPIAAALAGGRACCHL